MSHPVLASHPMLLPPQQWAQQQFKDLDLGDARLDRRAIGIAAAMAARPQESIPRQMQDPHQAKAAYRFFSRSDRVTFDALSSSHRQQTQQQMLQHKRLLLIGDVTEISYTHHPATRGLELIGDGKGRGFCLHSVLAVDDQKRIVGLAAQNLFYRQQVPPGETRTQRLQRERESRVWATAVKACPAPPRPDSRFIHVCDAGADNYGFYQACRQQGCDWITVAAQDRRAALGHAAQEHEGGTVRPLARAAAAAGGKRVWVQARKKGQKDRWAKLLVSFAPVTIFAPWLGGGGKQPPLRMWMVRCWEVDAPAEVKEPIEWLLLTSLPVLSLEQALEVMEFYCIRWLIEEYHKCLKSGCNVEKRQLEEGDRLEAMLGILTVVALRLLVLKEQTRRTPQALAVDHVEELAVQVLVEQRKLKQPAKQLTLYEFWREVAKLGGFLGRKSDGEPGWQTTWLGWRELQSLVQGAQIALRLRERCG